MNKSSQTWESVGRLDTTELDRRFNIDWIKCGRRAVVPISQSFSASRLKCVNARKVSPVENDQTVTIPIARRRSFSDIRLCSERPVFASRNRDADTLTPRSVCVFRGDGAGVLSDRII